MTELGDTLARIFVRAATDLLDWRTPWRRERYVWTWSDELKKVVAYPEGTARWTLSR